jgi:hypothetical protein
MPKKYLKTMSYLDYMVLYIQRALMKQLTTQQLPQKVGMILVIVVIAGFGVHSLLSSHAATPYSSGAASNGTLSGSATSYSDTTASNGQAVSFGGNKNPTGEFYTIGDKIVAPDGSIYFPEGANLATPDTLDTEYNAVGRSADVQAWGWNTVRLVTMCTPAGATWDYPSENGVPAFETMLNNLITEYTSKHIVVDVTCFDTSYGASNYATVMPELDSFWTYMGDTYKNNPYVWFDPMNEGFWEQSEATFVSWNQAMYTTIRSTGAENIMIVDAENSGNDAGWGDTPKIFTSGPLIANGTCNILFAMHNYGGLSDAVNDYSDYTIYNSYWTKVQAANIPMFVEEFGYKQSDPAQDNLVGANATLQVAPSYGIGGLWWAGISADDFSLKANGSYFDDGGNDTGLSTAGQDVWNYSHAVPNLGEFTGQYSQSNCSSTK